MSYEEHVESFNESMKGKPWWSRVLGSQFATGIATYVGQMVDRCEAMARRLLQESFMSTALKRASILAAAEDRGYVGRKITPSVGTAEITNTGTAALHFQYGTPLESPNKLPYVLYEALQLDPGETRQVKIAQLEEITLTAEISQTKKWLEILLTKELTQTAAAIDVFVTLPNRPIEQWEKRYQFRRADSDSKVYAEFYKPTEQLGVRFGNGLSGRIPVAGSTVTLTVWSTTGDSTLVEGQELKLSEQDEAITAAVKIKTVTPITGGAAGESTEEIRKGALYATAYDEQIVWDNDYRHFIRQNITGLIWLNVWGEVQQEKESGFSLSNVGRIFISAYSAKESQAVLAERILTLFAGTKELNRRYSYIPVSRRPFTVTIDAVIAPRQQTETVRQTMIDALETAFGENAVAGKGTSDDATIYEKDLWATLNALGNTIEFRVTVDNQEKNPKLNEYIFLDAKASTYNIRYATNA